MEKGCSACHSGINVGGGMYAPFGVVDTGQAWGLRRAVAVMGASQLGIKVQR